MQRMYQQYKDIAEFRLVYINEAHASDGRRPVAYAAEKGITEHDNYGERCTSAELLLNDENLTIPFVIDNMDNKVNQAYKAWPDRVFLVRSDGRLAVAAGRGPFGFEPGIREVKTWLAAYRRAGAEPALPDDAAPAGPEVDAQGDASATMFAALAGAWQVDIALGSLQTSATLLIAAADDGSITATWTSGVGQGTTLTNLTLTGDVLSFSHGQGEQAIRFQGRASRSAIRGKLITADGELTCTARRTDD